MSDFKIRPVDLEKEMRDSYLDYSMSVIVSRALPDVRDGFKPVHRRIVYGMQMQSLFPDRGFSKSTRLTGEVMAKYHPHGDAAIYDAVVRLTQDFNMRYPLIEGQGNFGSIDGDGAAAPRYTEVRMEKLCMEMLRDINKDTVDFKENYDGRELEPVVLPSRFPNLLVNGSTGIAVGMATNMAPHNLREAIDGAIAYLHNPDISIAELNQIIKGPDFPTGGIIMGRSGIKNAYETGRGKIKLRAKTEIVEKNNRQSIVITEIPYQVNKSNLIKKIAELVREKKIDGITYLRDASDRKGLKIVIDIRRDVNAEIVLNNLFKYTQLETTFGIINLALVDGVPKVLNLKELLAHYINHQIEVVTRRTQFDLNKAEARAHIVEGLLVAIDNIDEVIRVIRNAYSDAKEQLMERFDFTEVQAQSILDMQLRRLQGLEHDRLSEELKNLKEEISYLKSVLEDRDILYGIIEEEMLEIKDRFGDDRKSQIGEAAEAYELAELIDEEDVVISLTKNNYIKRTPVDTYRVQNRGGRGVIGFSSKDGDYVETLLTTSTHDTILFFTNMGRVYQSKGFDIPEAGRTARGTALINILPLMDQEEVTAVLSIEGKDGQLMMITKNGIIKRTSLDEFRNIRRTGIIAIGLDEGDELIAVQMVTGPEELLLLTRQAQVLRLRSEDIRPTGRNSRGVIAIRLEKDDEVVSMSVIKDNDYALFVTENGYGKKSKIQLFSSQNRGGKGVIGHRITKKTGQMIKGIVVKEEDEVLLISKKGDMIRMKVDTISTQGRYTSGVKIKDVHSEEDSIVAATKYIEDVDEIEK